MKAGAELCRRTMIVFKGVNHLSCILTCIVWPRIRRFAFSRRPCGLIGIQLWRAGRQILYPERRIEAAEDSNRFSVVSYWKGDDRPTQKRTDFSAADIAGGRRKSRPSL